MTSRTPIFNGCAAIILHRPAPDIERLTRRLHILGLRVTTRWTPIVLAETPADIVLVDADAGWDGLLPWAGAAAPMPFVALLGSEAPGRIAWALAMGADAVINKPIATAAVYPALVAATHLHAERAAARERIAALEERVRMRPLVFAAVEAIMRARSLGEAEAYRHLRGEAMRRRLALEQVAGEIVAGRPALPEAG
jgi:AmiR/NasT family two-component response regulator